MDSHDSHNEDFLLSMSIRMVQESLANGDISTDDIFVAYHDQITRFNPAINAFTQVASDRPDSFLGHLAGIPLAVKDIFDVVGYDTTAGSQFFRRRPTQDAYAVGQLRSAGCAIMGTTNTHEFAMGGTTINPHFGATHNPWDLKRIAGGSSGGSAAAIAAGMALVALGSDTAGSVRMPAAFCGVVGLKPTCGAISAQGVVPLSWSLDHVGLLTRSVEDLLAVWPIFSGDLVHGSRDSQAPIRVGVIYDQVATSLQPEVQSAMGTLIDKLADWDVALQPAQFPYWEESIAASFIVSRVEAATFHQPWLSTHPEQYGDDVRTLLEVGQQLTGTEYVQSLRMRQQVTEAYRALFSQVDFLISPTMAMVAPPLSAPPERTQLTQFTSPLNLVGLPALSFPIWGTSPLPAGLQIIAPWGQESALLQFAQGLEQLLGTPRSSPMLDPQSSQVPK